MRYFIWTEGCQMNAADSLRVAGALEALGYTPAPAAEESDVIVLNTCVVRQSAEDKAYGRLTSLRPLKKHRPEVVINLMGCLVGHRDSTALRKRFPYVDVFSPPSDPRPLLQFLAREGPPSDSRPLIEYLAREESPRAEAPDPLPSSARGRVAAAYLPVVLGCSHACSYCIIPYRRGGERSRPAEEILREAAGMAAQGVREVTLLGQIVDRYGLDNGQPGLPDLLRRLQVLDGLARIRFLTSHPKWMTDDLLRAVAELPKVCEHIEVPVQAGDDEVLSRMRRGYTADDYRRLVGRIRDLIPGASIATDVIVGFPGETEAQFQRTFDLLSELRLDVAHLARYSPREGTLSARKYPDDVPAGEKMVRFRALEALQESIAVEKNGALMGTRQEVLVEGMHKGRWMGRTRTNRLAFFDPPLATAGEPPADLLGVLAAVHITRTSAWSLQGELSSE